jgi:hypothetical protein
MGRFPPTPATILGARAVSGAGKGILADILEAKSGAGVNAMFVHTKTNLLIYVHNCK